MDRYTSFRKIFNNLAREARGIVITSHVSPDDDSISSVLATYYYITEVLNLSTPVRMIYTGDDKYQNRYSYFKNFKKINWVPNSLDYIKKDDLVIVLDVQGLSRVTDSAERVRNIRNQTICIDHHTGEVDRSHRLVFNELLSSTAETLYRLFFISDRKQLSREICEIILLGIIGDTGSFRFIKPENVEVMDTARDLIRQGNIRVEEFKSKYDKKEVRHLQIFAKFLTNIQFEKIKGWPTLVYSYIESTDIKGYSNVEIAGGTSDMKEALKNIHGADWGFVVRPRPRGNYAVSFRSIPGSVNVRIILEDMGIGGGHDLAAGGTFKVGSKVSFSKEVIEKILDYLRTHEPVYT